MSDSRQSAVAVTSLVAAFGEGGVPFRDFEPALWQAQASGRGLLDGFSFATYGPNVPYSPEVRAGLHPAIGSGWISFDGPCLRVTELGHAALEEHGAEPSQSLVAALSAVLAPAEPQHAKAA